MIISQSLFDRQRLLRLAISSGAQVSKEDYHWLKTFERALSSRHRRNVAVKYKDRTVVSQHYNP